MVAIKGLQARIAKLEPKPSKTAVIMKKFEPMVKAGIKSGFYDPDEMPVVLKSLKRWVRDGY
jgi:hypothetical protein